MAVTTNPRYLTYNKAEVQEILGRMEHIDDVPTGDSDYPVKSSGVYKAINVFEDIFPDEHLENHLSFTQVVGQAPQYGTGEGGTDKYGPYTTQKEITFDIIASGYYGFALVGPNDKIADYTSSNNYSEAAAKEWIVPVGYYLLLSTSKSQHVKARASDIKIINGKVIECERIIDGVSTIAACDTLLTSVPVDGSFVLSTGDISYVSGWEYCAFDVSKIKAGTYIGIYGRSESSKCLGAWEDGDGNRTPIIMTAASMLSKGEKFLKQSDAVKLYVNSRTSDFNAIIVYNHPYQFADVVNEDDIYDWVAVTDMPIESETTTGYYIDSEGNEHEATSSYYYKTFDIKDYKYGSTIVFSGRTITDGVIGRFKFKNGAKLPILLPADSTVYKDQSISIPFDATEISLNSTVDADWQLTVSASVSGFKKTAKYASKELSTEVDEIGKTVDEIGSTMFTEEIKDYSIPGTPSEPDIYITVQGEDYEYENIGWHYKRYVLKPYYKGHKIVIDGKSAFNKVIGRWNYQDGTKEAIVMSAATTVYAGHEMDIPDNASSIDVMSPMSGENKAVAKNVLVKEENYVRKDGAVANYYNGKTIWWCGTSIPAGNANNNYPKMVGEILGADVINVAVPGSMCRANVRTGINEAVGSYKGAVFENISSAITMTNQEIEDFISDYDNIKGRLRDYGSPSSGIPESLDTTNLNRLRAASFENRLLPYLNGDYPMPDLFVIDHGHNDFKYTLHNGTTDIGVEPIRTNISKNQSEANTILEEDSYMTRNNYANLKSFFSGLSHVDNSNGTGDNNFINSDFDKLACSLNRNCYKGAVNFIVTLILTYNPQARILFISNYEHEHGDYTTYAPLITAQNDIAASWAFPLFEVYKYLGFSNHIIPGSKAFLAQHGYTFANDVDMFKIYCPDTVHPHSDQTKHANEVYAGVLAEFIKTCR